MNRKSRVLVLAPHTDDAELGCGGTMAKWLEAGAEIHVAVFSTAKESRPPGSPETLLADEFYAAMETYPIPRERTTVLDYPVRWLSYHRQEVLEDMIRLRERIKPQFVLIPSVHDVHQDHQVVHAEAVRAFRNCSLWGYELPWNHFQFSTQAYVSLSETHIASKLRSLQAYRSQIKMGRPYFNSDFVRGLARIRGVQIGEEMAETFEVIRMKY